MESMRGSSPGDAGIDADALLEAHAEDRIRNLEAGLGRVPVDGGDVFEEVVAGIFCGLGGGEDCLGSDREGELLAIPLGVGDEVLECSDGDMVGEGFGDGLLAEDGVGSSGIGDGIQSCASFPQGLKPRLASDFMARLKPCPFKEVVRGPLCRWTS
jgi:hypothetical protein